MARKRGGHPKEVQTLMRHSTITLTMDTYGHLFPGQEAEIVNHFHIIDESDSDAIAATGTDGTTTDPQLYPQQLGRETKPSDAKQCESEEQDDGERSQLPSV